MRGSYQFQLFPDSASGGGLDLVRTVMVLVGAGASVVFGVADDIFSLQMAFVGVAIFSVIPAARILVVAVLDRREHHRGVTPG